MADTTGTSGASRRQVAAAGGAGVVAGAGVSTGLFALLGVKEILAGPQSASLAYPISIFSLVALFALVAALFTVPVRPDQRRIVIFGIVIFAVTAVLGAAPSFIAELRRPRISFTTTVAPDWVTGDGKAWTIDGSDPRSPKLRMVYRTDGGKVTAYAPLKTGLLSVADGGVVALKIEGIEDLLAQYQSAATRRDETFRFTQMACQRDPALACEMLRAKDLPH